VFLALQPVAVEHVNRDLTDAVGPDVEIPARQRRRRQRSHVCKDKPAEFLDRIALEPPRDFAFGTGFQRPLETLPRRPEEPAVIWAAQASLVGNAELEINASMQTAVSDEAEVAAAIAVKHKVFAENADLTHGVFEELSVRRDGNPVAAHQLAAWRARPYPRQPIVHFRGHRLRSPSPSVCGGDRLSDAANPSRLSREGSP